MRGFRPFLLLFLSVAPSAGATFGTVVAHAQPLADLVLDEARKRLYVVNTASNQVEVYSTTTNPPRQTNVVKTDSTPLAMAIARSGKSLYVACYGASSLDIIDLTSANFTWRPARRAWRWGTTRRF
jgi:DNA-binding beta-propeller fold protein YncE